MSEPQDRVAALFMTNKGYPGWPPVDVDRVPDIPCWYYRYLLPEGLLEVEVYWDGAEWKTTVTAIQYPD